MGLRLKCLLMIINFCLLTSAPVVDELKEVIDEVDGLHSSNSAEDKYKIHKILEELSQMVSILILCTVILVVLHFKVQTVSIILYYYLSLKLMHCLGTWSLCDFSCHYLHVPDWLICKLFDKHSTNKVVSYPGDMQDHVMTLLCWKERVEMLKAKRVYYMKVPYTLLIQN